MPILAYHHSPDWTQELYQATIDQVIPDTNNLPSGMIAHYAAPLEGGGWQVVDVWESAEHHDRFLRERVIPGGIVKSCGLAGQPNDRSVKQAACGNGRTRSSA
ncbi:hypothetical protein, partial [Streptomyces caelestis]|uniref:hypothetical protein n=1 Tax=Streptomyces caelestis TaxID=36816 RepID=UPI0036FEB860